METVFQLGDVHRSFGAVQALRDVDLTVGEGGTGGVDRRLGER